MKFIEYLKEEYCASKEIVGTPVTVFVNPTSVEITQVGGKKVPIRFIADSKEKNLYIWNGDIAIHIDIFDLLEKKGEIKKSELADIFWRDSNFLTGIAWAKSGKMDFFVSDQLEPDIRMPYVADMMRLDWSWMKQYFTDMNYLTKLKKKIKIK